MKKLVLLLAFVAGGASAAVNAPSSAFDSFMWQATGGASQTVTYGSGGTPLVSPGLPSVDTDGGLPKVTQSASIKNPAGNPVSVSLLSRIPASAVASAIAGGVGAQLVWAAGSALYDLAKERGFTIMKDSAGVATVTKVASGPMAFDASIATTGAGLLNLPLCPNPASSWRTVGYCKINASGDGMYAFVDQATRDVLISRGWQYTNNLSPYFVLSTTSTVMNNWYPNRTQTESNSSLQNFVDDIASQSGWPAGSKIAQALVDSAALTQTKLQPSPGTLTGPATSTGTTTTKTNADGSKVVTTTNYNHTYQGNKIITGATTTNNYYNSTNVLTGTDTTTSEPEPAPETQSECEKYPDIIGCSKYGTPANADTLNKQTSAVTITPSTFAVAGSCPSPITFSVASQNYSFSYDSLCARLQALRTLFLAIAAFIAAWVIASALKV